MKRFVYLGGLVVSIIGTGYLLSLPSFAQNTAPSTLDAAGLKTMIQGLGYETKDLITTPGKEKYEFSVTRPDFNVPIGAEVSPSRNYIWLTVFLAKDGGKVNYQELLKQNGKIQPAQFYVTSGGNLMLGIAIDNRSVNAAVLRRNVDMISKDVSDTSSIWNVK